ncbi:corrinoid ABC transporter substrate-binding protein [Betaproteobacteria bacterium MOLA814]|jgi:iron complex transport system substrate-binding protein|nr:corrinoid ABC transporter substrate-binding protein [Betaproteobacteria bacterium MOLA814]
MSDPFSFPLGPQRIVCMTEETTEWLYLLGQEARIVGISGFTVRPRRARSEKPRVSAFTSAKIDKILALQPDCVLGFSDLQADIAAVLIRAGVQVTVYNQRSVAEIFSMMYQVASMVGEVDQGMQRIVAMQQGLQAMQDAVTSRLAAGARRPKVFFEEWDVPHISAIQWVSELIGIAGGDDCFPELAQQSLGKNRIIADGFTIVQRSPDIILGSWCGKKFRPETVAARDGWADVPAVRNGQLFEIKSPDILQPGPAALTDGVGQIHKLVLAWMDADLAGALAP